MNRLSPQLRNAKAIMILMLFFVFAVNLISCTEQSVNSNLTPHEITAKVLEEFGFAGKNPTLSQLEETGEEISEIPAIHEYYSGGDFDHTLDDFMMYAVFSQVSDRELTVDMFEEYSIIEYQPSFPFELVILKLPKNEGKTDAELLEEVKNMCTENIKNLKSQMQDYAPDYISYAEKAEVTVFDNFVFYCVTENPEEVNTFIKDLLVFTGNSAQNSESSLSESVENQLSAETEITEIAETSELEEEKNLSEATFLKDDGTHRYYKFETYRFLDRFVKDEDGNLRKKFDVQLKIMNRLSEASKEADVDFYVYVCTRMQDTNYMSELIPGELSTNDFFEEFLSSITGCTGIGSLDIGTMEKRLEHLWRTDHHWSAMGAYSAYVDIVNMVSENTPEVGDPIELNENKLIVFDDVKARGSFANIIQFDEYYEPLKVLDITLPEFAGKGMFTSNYELYAAGKYNKDKYTDHYSSYYNTLNTKKYELAEKKNGRNLLIIGDSYAWWSGWLIAANFDNVYVYLWDNSRLRYKEYLEENNITDVLVMQFSDRFFFDYYNDSNLRRISLN